MKILRLKLVNYIGIKHGLDQDEIEINIPDNDIPFIMLIGKNGSGKSTILSQMHPFKESFDDRKDLIIPGTIGIKEFDFEVDGDIYKVKHVFDKKTSSFIMVNDEELNPNGGVRTFEDIIYQRLGLTKEYMKIGKIGSNIGNFVQSTTAERKVLIASFVSEVVRFIDAFNVVSEKFKFDNEKLKSVAKELSTYSDPTSIESQLNEHTEELRQIDQLIVENSQRVAVLQSEVERAKEELEKIDYIKVKDDLAYYESQHKNAISTKANIRNMYIDRGIDADIEKIDELKERLHSDQINKSVFDSELNQMKNNLVEMTNNKAKTEYKLNGLGNANQSIDQLINETDSLGKEISDITKRIDENPLKEFIANPADIPYNLQCYNNFMTYILQNYSQLNGETLQPGMTNIDLFFKKDCPDIIRSAVIQSRTSIQSINDTKLEKEKDYATKSASLGKLEILAKRPKSCGIDTCPFIADALQYKDLPDQLKKLEDEIRTFNANIESMNKKAEWIDDIKDLFKNTVTQYKLLGAQGNPIYRYQCSIYGNISKFMKQPINIIKEVYETIKSLSEEYLGDANNLILLKTKYDRNNENIASIQNSADIRTMYVNEISEIVESMNILSSNIISKTKETNDLRIKIDNDLRYINDLDRFIDQTKIISKSEKAISELTVLRNKYEALNDEYQKKIAQSNNNAHLVEITKERKGELANLIRDGQIALARIKDLNKKQKELENSYAMLKLVKDSLDPKSGIPLIFIQAYLGKTELIANELLKIAFDDKFSIHFNSNAKDFFIKVTADGEEIEDIRLASQGEVALTTISISLALIEQYSGSFNILSLDEMDGTLDDNNREAFISILDSQIRKLGIEQVFIISHNNAFDNVPMNIIAFPGSESKTSNSEFMRNKTIIFSAN